MTARDVLGYIVSGGGLGGSAVELGVAAVALELGLAATGLFLLLRLFRGGVMFDTHVEWRRPTVPPMLPPIMAEITIIATTTVIHNVLREVRDTLMALPDSTCASEIESTVC